MCEPFLGQILMFAGNFAPRGWALCDGQMLQIAEHQALFSILGNQFGGDGTTTFALPNLRGRVPIHPRSGPGTSTRRVGRKGGHRLVHLNNSRLANPAQVELAAPRTNDTPTQIDLDHDNMPPYLFVNYIIAVEGIYPSRP